MADIRLFAAIPLDPEDAAALSKAARAMAHEYRDLRAIAPERIHLTIKFIGRAPEAVLPEISACLGDTAAACRPFTMTFSRLVFLPSPRNARVVAVEPEAPGAEILQLAELVESKLRVIGIVAEERPYRPHITFARAKKPIRSAKALRPLLESAVPSVLVRAGRLVLYRSHFAGDAHDHTALGEFPFF